jgi:hypothetical protein
VSWPHMPPVGLPKLLAGILYTGSYAGPAPHPAPTALHPDRAWRAAWVASSFESPVEWLAIPSLRALHCPTTKPLILCRQKCRHQLTPRQTSLNKQVQISRGRFHRRKKKIYIYAQFNLDVSH